MKEMNVCYQNQDDYQLPYITTKEQKELHIGVWANRHRQYLKQHHRKTISQISILFGNDYLLSNQSATSTIFTPSYWYSGFLVRAITILG